MGKAVLIAFFIGLIAGAALVTVIRRRKGKSAAAGVAPNPLIKEAAEEIKAELRREVKHKADLKTALDIIDRVRKRGPG